MTRSVALVLAGMGVLALAGCQSLAAGRLLDRNNVAIKVDPRAPDVVGADQEAARRCGGKAELTGMWTRNPSEGWRSYTCVRETPAA